MSRYAWIAALALCAGAHALRAAAAPTTSEDGNVGSDELHPAPRTLPSLAVPSAGDQTLDRLIQLQPRTAGIEFKERPAATPAAMKLAMPPAQMPAVAKPVPAPPPQTPSGLFGSGAVPRPAVNHGASNIEPPWKQREMANRPAAYGDRPRDDLPAARLLLIPREVILYIREHREWVIGGSLAALAVFWGASAALARRRARAQG